MIDIDHLTVRYGDHVALEDISLHVAPGEFVLITGASGCGKSTLARCLDGIVPHSIPADITGAITVDGINPTQTTVADMATRVGIVFQNPFAQFFNLTVDEETAFGPRNLGLADDEILRRARWTMEATGIAHLTGRRVQTLSGGEAQRLAIASVLAMGSRVLVLDEPTSSLDVQGTREVLATLKRLSEKERVTILIIEHRLGEVARCAPRTIILDQGRIVADGRTNDIFERREMLRALGLRRPTAEVQDDWGTLVGSKGKQESPVLVELKNVEAGYNSQMVLRGIDMALHAGEFAALVGSNGSGKSTLARVLAGLIKPHRGQVRWSGGRMPKLGGGVGLLFQNPLHQLFCDTVGEEVEFGPRNLDCYKASERDEILAATDLTLLRGSAIQSLSSGQQQRTALAAILALRPSLIILDEPTVGQDWQHLSRFMDFVVDLNRRGCTILLVTHDYKLVHRYARRMILLREGRIVADGVPMAPRPFLKEEAHEIQST